MKRKVAIIGHFGGNENFLDGQTVKTCVVYEELRNLTDWDIQKVDTYFLRKPWMLVVWSVRALFTAQDVIVLLSRNGMRVYFPMLFFFKKMFGTRVYHNVIGGNLAELTQRYRGFKKYLSSFCVNWVETDSIKRKLEELGVKNVEILPNMKRLATLDDVQLQTMTWEEPYKVCTFSRVMREKGIEDAVEAVNAVNTYFGRTVYTLDIYGQVDPGQETWFEELRRTFPKWIRYVGQVPFDKSVETLKGYYALLFPTRFYTEGVPGTIIDAYAAGIPVIAAKWESFGDIIREEYTGVGYRFGDQQELEEKLRYACEHPEQWNAMRPMCLEAAEKYRPENVIRTIIAKIEGERE